MTDIEEMGELVTCDEPAPRSDLNACPREKDHDGEHYCWWEVKLSGNEYGVTVATHAGEKVYHMTMEGTSTPKEICAIVTIMEFLAKRRSERARDDD